MLQEILDFKNQSKVILHRGGSTPSLKTKTYKHKKSNSHLIHTQSTPKIPLYTPNSHLYNLINLRKHTKPTPGNLNSI